MSFTKSVVLPVSPDEAFALVTEPERLRRWQTVTATVDLRAGGSYRWTVTPGHVAEGTYREIEPGRRVVFGWGWEGSDDLPRDASTVTISIEPVAEGSRVTLVHDGLTEEQAAQHAEGWHHYVERLERVAAGGEAGPDEWASAPERPHPAARRRGRPRRPAAGAPQPHRRGPRQADPVLGVQHPRAGRAPPRLAGPARHHGRGVRLGAHTGSLEDRVSGLTAQAVAAWAPVDLDSTVPGPGGADVPAAFLAGILPLELVIHGWDLAQASGQRLHVSDEVASYVRGLAEGVIGQGRGSSFADEVAPAADADALDRLAAYAGRTALTV